MNARLWKFLHLIRKLRWIGMEEEAERVEMKLRETTLAGSIIFSTWRKGAQ